MPIGSASFMAGQYTVAWNSQLLGIFDGTDAGLPAFDFQIVEQPIDNTDAYGGTYIDGVYRGANAFFSGILDEYKAATIGTMWPSTIGGIFVLGVIGRLMSALASSLVFTAIAGIPAATNPATITFGTAILAPGFPVKLLFGPRLRQIPLRQRLMAYLNAGNTVLGVTT